MDAAHLSLYERLILLKWLVCVCVCASGRIRFCFFGLWLTMNAFSVLTNRPLTPWGTHVTFDLSASPDCTEVWHSERRGAEALDRGHHRRFHRARLPERPKEWSHPVRVRSSGALTASIISFYYVLWFWKTEMFPSFLSLSHRLINKLAPNSVKKVNQSALNWHQVSRTMTHPFLTKRGCGKMIVCTCSETRFCTRLTNGCLCCCIVP